MRSILVCPSIKDDIQDSFFSSLFGGQNNNFRGSRTTPGHAQGLLLSLLSYNLAAGPEVCKANALHLCYHFSLKNNSYYQPYPDGYKT